jgi:hypothetical protein
MWLQISNPSTEEVEAGEPRVGGHPELQEKPCLNLLPQKYNLKKNIKYAVQ